MSPFELLSEELEEQWRIGKRGCGREIAWNNFQGLPSKDRNFPLEEFYKASLGPKGGEGGMVFQGISPIPLETAWGGFANYLKERIPKRADPLVLLHYALWQESFFLYIPAGKEEKLMIEHYIEGDGGLLQSALCIALGRGSKLTIDLKEKRFGNRPVHRLLDCHLEPNSELICTHSIPPTTFSLDSCFATLAPNSFLKGTILSEGGLATRGVWHVQLAERSKVELRGLARVSGRRQAHLRMKVEHKGKESISCQKVHCLAGDWGRASFTGDIHIQPKAQKSSATQINRNLTLSNYAHCTSIPALHIHADDVQATHGATIGQLSADDIFYLRSRGINEKSAKQMLIDAFCQDIIPTLSRNNMLKLRL